MSKLQKLQRTHWTHIDNEVLQDSRLSYRARGLAAFLLSKPNDWDVSISRLAMGDGTEGQHSIRSAMKELITYGYASRARTQDARGRFQTQTHIADHPAFTETNSAERLTGYKQAGTDPPESDRSVHRGSIKGKTIRKEKNSIF